MHLWSSIVYLLGIAAVFGSATPTAQTKCKNSDGAGLLIARGSFEVERSVAEAVKNQAEKECVDEVTEQEQSGNSEDVAETFSSDPPKATDCTCIPFHKCRNGAVKAKGTNLIDLRVAKNKRRVCGNELEVCCSDPGPRQQSQHDRTEANYQSKCGVRNVAGSSGVNIRNFQKKSQFGEFPWMVALLQVESLAGEEFMRFKCGGSLIHPGIILTAAHCVYFSPPSRIRARVGEWNARNDDYEPERHQDINVSHFDIHPEFNIENLDHDFALIFLETEAILNKHIDTICLPQEGESFDGALCTSSGWGKDNFEMEGRYQSILKRIDLPIVPFKECQDTLRTTRLSKHFILSPTFICAGGIKGLDTCTGDGGSPLVCPSKQDPNIYVQVGIVAWGIGCGEKEIPGVYADVTTVAPWINSYLQIDKDSVGLPA